MKFYLRVPLGLLLLAKYHNTSLSNDNAESPNTRTTSQIRQEDIQVNRNTRRSHATSPQDIVRIVVLGRKGTGVSSTVKELIGPLTKCKKSNDGDRPKTLHHIYEYTISDIPGTASQLKLIDLPGFFDDPQQDSQILATLKSYISDVGSPPDLFLAISKFDDNPVGIHSPFVQFMRKIDLFKNTFLEELFQNKTNIVFLLTKLMSETKTIRRRPSSKIGTFRRLIEDFTTLPRPSQIIVGDNRAHSEYEAEVQEGYYKLPNGDLYPKNVWDAMISSTGDIGPTTGSKTQSVLNAMKNSRQVKLMKCDAKLISTNWEGSSDDATAFLYLLRQENTTVQENEVNLKIDESFHNLTLVPDKMNMVIQKTALQLYLQNRNITNSSNFPTGPLERASFFQGSELTSSSYAVPFMNFTFGLEMPEYIQPLTVGYGYDVLGDELSLETPFNSVEVLPTQVGYQFPSFMNCKPMPTPEVKKFQSYSGNISEYFGERLNHLHFTGDKEEEEGSINREKFTGRAKAGYNLAPEEHVEIATLTAAKELRTMECALSDKNLWGELNEDFLETVNALEPVDLYNRDSVTEWTVFFSKYGSHIVSKGYGGGRLVGSVTGRNARKAYESQSLIDQILESILEFKNSSISQLEKPSYGMFGGEVEGEPNKLYELPGAQRDEMLREWESSLKVNFEMLKDEFTLQRISMVVREKVGEEKGDMVDEAIGILLRGELKRKRRTSGAPTRNRTTTRRPSTNTVTTTTFTTTTTTTPPPPHLTRDPIKDDGAYQVPPSPPSTPHNSDWDTNTHTDFGGGAHNSQTVVDIIKQQREQAQKNFQEQMRAIDKMNEEAAAKHLEEMTKLEVDYQLKKRKEERCDGISKVRHWCWSDFLYNKEFSREDDEKQIRERLMAKKLDNSKD